MKILMINKFLFPKGGAETYALKLGEYLSLQGHEVQYFGMDHPKRTVGNALNAYTKTIDFHESSLWEQLTYPARIIYSTEARRKLRMVLDHFQPEVCHLNNFNYQLTPSILLEIKKWSRSIGKPCKIVYTAHDYQLLCPNHSCNNPSTHSTCEKCLGGNYLHCVKHKCIHSSMLRSILGMLESTIWHASGVYKHIDTIICCSNFIKSKLDTNPLFASRTVTMHNFTESLPFVQPEKQNYVLYFGRYSEEKGIGTLLEAARALPDIPFVFAGSGPMEHLLKDIPNVRNVGFQTGEALHKLIREAKFSIYPSEWYENCPFSVIESQMLGTPVIGSNIGGIPELIVTGKTGELYESKNTEQLTITIQNLWDDPDRIAQYSRNCLQSKFCTLDSYHKELLKVYTQ